MSGELAAGLRKARFATSSGRTVNASYGPADLHDLDYDSQLGAPGQPPYTRGPSSEGYRAGFWGFEFYAGFGSAAEANERYRFLLEQGGTGGVSIALDLPTQLGLDADHPLARREIGRVGVCINTLEDASRIFSELDFAQIGSIFSTANAIAPVVLAWILELTEDVDRHAFVVTLQNDPLKEYAARGTQFLPVEPAVELACDVVQYCVEAGLEWYPISVSGSHMKQAGATCAEEAAFTLANAMTYVDSLKRRGMDIAQVARQMELHFSTDMDFFEEVAKYRVVRRVWTELLEERYGVTGVRPRVHAVASGLPLTAQQPLNNIVRISMEVLAHVLGGVDQARTACYDEALAIPTEDAVKLSIRANQIVAHETGVADVVDPLGGSYYLERLTLDMYDEIREILETIETMGGAIAAIESGYIAGRLAEGAYRQQRELEDGERVVVGVNDWAEGEETPIPVFRSAPEWADRQLEELAAFKARRNQAGLERALEAVRGAAGGGANSVPVVRDAVRAGATIGEICAVWRESFGEWQPYARRLA
jgi:methylmalonyl-CoA mutase N-terminal domain/subunit